jgi:hypothetical protein
MTKKTPEHQSEERFPLASGAINLSHKAIHRNEEFDAKAEVKREAYADCIREKVEPLEEWKESAIKVMGEWGKVHEALGKPGKLGESMADASLAEVVRLRALVQVLGNAFVRADNGSVEQDGTKQASGHAHHIHAIWDMDNGPAKAGKPCLKCLAFDAARLALKQERFVPTNTQDNG